MTMHTADVTANLSAPRTTYFMGYQQNWLTDSSRQKVGEKSRRIGWTYVQAYEDMQDAAKADGMDVWFSSADLSAAREYMRYVEMWSKLGNVVAKDLEPIRKICSTEVK